MKNWITALLSVLVILLGIWSLAEVVRGTEAKAFESMLWSNPPRLLTRTLGLTGGVLFVVFGSIEFRRSVKRLRLH